MGIENWPQPVTTPDKPKLNRAEKVEALKNVNINDSDVLEKLAEILGNKVDDFHENELEALRKYAQEGGHQPLEWSMTTTNDKLFIEDDGTIILGNTSLN